MQRKAKFCLLVNYLISSSIHVTVLLFYVTCGTAGLKSHVIEGAYRNGTPQPIDVDRALVMRIIIDQLATLLS